MIFTTTAKILFMNDEEKYIIKDVDCIDISSDTFYIHDEENDDKLKAIGKSKSPVLKQYVMSVDGMVENGRDSDETIKKLFTGDIVNISKKKRSNDYEVVVINGEVKGKEINSGFIIDIKSMIEDDTMVKTLTSLHRNKEGDIINI